MVYKGSNELISESILNKIMRIYGIIKDINIFSNEIKQNNSNNNGIMSR